MSTDYRFNLNQGKDYRNVDNFLKNPSFRVMLLIDEKRA